MAKKLLLSNGGGGSDLLIDFTQSTAPAYPSYFTEYSKLTYSFVHKSLDMGGGTLVHGLYNTNYPSTRTTARLTFKYVAPASGTLQFKWNAYVGKNSYFTIHVTTSGSAPSYSSSTNRVTNAYNTLIYQHGNEATSTVKVTGGTTYYIHVQLRNGDSSSSSYWGRLNSIELIPSE